MADPEIEAGGPEEKVDGPEEGGCLPGPEEVAIPVELLFGGGRLCGPGEVDGPVDRCRLAGPEEALAGLFVFLA